jgi:hypothetical protein
MFRAYLDSIADLDPRVAELYTQDENGRYLLNVEELVDRLNIHDDDRYVLNTEQVIDRIVAYDPDYLNHAELTAQPLMARIVYARIDFIHRTGELPTDVYF